MKKIFLMLLVLSLFLIPSPRVYADTAFDIGRAIGNAMGDGMANAPYKGDIDKNFYKDEFYDFSRLNKFLIIARIVPETANYVMDPYILTKYPALIQKEIGDKYKVKTMNDVTKQYFSLYPEKMNLPQEELTNNLVQFAQSTSDAIIFANIHAYFVAGRTNNAKVEFIITPVGESYTIFNYTESRLNVERGTKERTIKIIAEHFSDKFKDTFKNSKQ